MGNQISRSDEIPEIVALPVGFYTVVARAEKAGIHPRARCYQRRPTDDPRLGRMGKQDVKAVRT